MGYNYINIRQILETTQISNICKKIECCVHELTLSTAVIIYILYTTY